MFKHPLFTSKTINSVSWKPQTSWLIVLRKQDGMRDVRSFSGTYAEAVIQRDAYLKGSLYASAWIIEERERARGVNKERERKTA